MDLDDVHFKLSLADEPTPADPLVARSERIRRLRLWLINRARNYQ